MHVTTAAYKGLKIGALGTGIFELSDMGVGNLTRVLYKSNTHP